MAADVSSDIPASSQRASVVLHQRGSTALPSHVLPEGYHLELAATSPLVTHPIMGCLDDKGRLFVGDAVGVNWNKAQLDANPPNRVLLLEDADKDGWFEKSTVFADKLTFPQGAQWLNGSLYVASPPGIWKLTDTDDDGVADQRESIVTGFDYTGNAADIHGPFYRPQDGRLYWCHGRKGHQATDKAGVVVHQSMACGIWSCKPDGSDLSWHSLGCGDNPVEVDFTPEGDIIGVQNLYYTQPRGDTIVHWLYGGVYERSDQLKVIAGEARTLETMPVMYNFGHVAVSGSCFWKKSAFIGGYQYLVTHFNTQRLVRMELVAHGSTYKATENEFLKLENPDIHFTDVMEEADGSLLLLDTGGWFRSGCPSSLMAKPDVMGAIYRIRADRKVVGDAVAVPSTSLQKKLRECEAVAKKKQPTDADRDKVFALLETELDEPLEHAALYAARKHQWSVRSLYESAKTDALKRRLLRLAAEEDGTASAWGLAAASAALKSADEGLVAAAGVELAREGRDPSAIAAAMQSVLPLVAEKAVIRSALKNVIKVYGQHDAVAGLVVGLLKSQPAWATSLIANGGVKPLPELVEVLKSRLKQPNALLLDAVKTLKQSSLNQELQNLADDVSKPTSLRLRALGAMTQRRIAGATFDMVREVLVAPTATAAARIQAASLLAGSGLGEPEKSQLAAAFATVGPVEMKELLPLIKSSKDPVLLKSLVHQLAKNPALISQQESIYRTALADKPVELFEDVLLPAYRKGMEGVEAKKRQLTYLADRAVYEDAKAGKAAFELGKGTCIACHKVGSIGRAIGPDLSKIGAIRTERDLLESILYPSNTLARDYEAHILETSSGETILGVIKSHTAEGLLVCDAAGMEKNVPHEAITSDTTLTTSLMPMGLDQAMSETELLQIVAYLRSLK
jgi:putative membrane-bound dehydrogenase-like protein